MLRSIASNLNNDQQTALKAAKRAQAKLERLDAARSRALSIRVALDAGVSYGQLAAELGLPRGTVQAAKQRGERIR